MKNKLKVISLIFLLVLSSGCTKQFKNSEGQIIKDKKTNQILIENIICKPIELKNVYKEKIEEKKSDYLEKYEKGDLSKKEYKTKLQNILNLDKLPKCSDISITKSKYESFWTNFFILPLAWILVKIGLLIKNYGFSIIIVTFFIKLILLPLTFKSLKQSENLKKAQPKLNQIEKKYSGKNDQESMMMKSNEMMSIYKEYKINPLSGCLTAFLQIPIFFAFYEALNRLPVLFEGKFLCFHMGITPLAAIQNYNWYYLILPLLVGIVTYFSFKMTNQNDKNIGQTNQMKTMFNIMAIVIFITSFSMSVAIIIYWITNSIISILQNLLVKRSK